jgi:tetratricopeptide (TPR) repeat protein
VTLALVTGYAGAPMATIQERQLDQTTMLKQIEQVVARGKQTDPPAFTLILGAGASFGVVPTARQMLGIPDRGIHHPKCIPAYLHDRETGALPTSADLARCVRDFWKGVVVSNDGRCSLKFDADGMPNYETVPDAYKFLFSQEHVGGLNDPGEGRNYLRFVTMGTDGRVQLNGTHFFLGSLLSLQNRRPEERDALGRPLYVGRRHFARTIFTTNFDPLLQVSLQLFQNLYYMTDRPELLATDALHTDDHPALHLFYAHGSVHRPGPKNTAAEIDEVKRLNAKAIAPYLATHGVIVLGYSGWDDCLLQALNECTSFRHNLYWLCRGEKSLSTEVQKFLLTHANAKWVSINDAGEFMAILHRQLCPGMPMTELLANPIAPLRERLEGVDLSGILGMKTAYSAPDKAEAPITAEELRQQVVNILGKMEEQFSRSDVADDPEVEVQKIEHQADLAYSSKDWATALDLYHRIAEHPHASVAMKAKALVSRGRCYGETGRRYEEIRDYTRAIDLPGAPPEQLARALVNRGVCHEIARRGDEAIADHTQAIDLPGAPPELVAMALVNRGLEYGRAEQVDKAIADCTRAIDLPGTSPEIRARALLARGFNHGNSGQKDEAIADYTRAIDLPGAPPEDVALALVNRGLHHRNSGRPDEELADYSRAIDLPGVPPESLARALVNRGVCHENAGRTGKAIADYTRAIDLPDAPRGEVNRARLSMSRLISPDRTLEDPAVPPSESST